MKPVTINFEELENRCRMSEEEFFGFGDYYPVFRKGYTSTYQVWDKELKKNIPKTYQTADEQSFYLFKDNNARILAVVHLDTVVSTDTNWTFQQAVLGHNNNKRHLLWNAQLDDRLGAYILMDLLPKYLGQHAYDILLTTDEESSNSTAEDFVLPAGKDYNWIFQFDRRGTGAVLYGYEDKAWRETVDAFLPVETGSFSDICKLYDLGVKGLNVGTGYHAEHQELCYMNVDETIDQVTKFIHFYNLHKNTKFPHDPHSSFGSGRWGGGGAWDDDQWWDGRGRSDYWKGSYDDRFPSTSATANNGRLPLTSNAASDLDEEYSELVRSMTRYDNDGNYTSSDDSTDMQTRVGRLSDVQISNISDVSLVPASDFMSDDPMAWISLPSVKRLIMFFQFPEWASTPTQVDVYHNLISHNRAVYCKGCSTAVPLDEVEWTKDSTPLCFDCIPLLPNGVLTYDKMPDIISEIEDDTFCIHLTASEIRWVREGGGLRLGSVTKRTYTGVKKVQTRCSCDFCFNAEWETDLVEFLTPTDNAPMKMCRVCFDSYQLETEGATSLDDTQPVDIEPKG